MKRYVDKYRRSNICKYQGDLFLEVLKITGHIGNAWLLGIITLAKEDISSQIKCIKKGGDKEWQN